jgi:hypothetical protein
MPDELGLLKERVNLRTLLVAIVTAAIGMTLILLSQSVGPQGYVKSAVVLKEIGGALFISVAVALLWDLVGKRAFADEVLAKANMSRDLADAGIQMVLPSFQDERLKWDELFRNACRLDMFVAYASTWRNTQLQRIDKFLSDPDAKLRVLLPDPADEDILKGLAKRFSLTPDRVHDELVEALEFFKHRREKAKGTVDIFVTTALPVFTFYRFNNRAVFALYNNRTGRLPVPAMLCEEGGFLFSYLTAEFEGLIGDTDRTHTTSA